MNAQSPKQKKSEGTKASHRRKLQKKTPVSVTNIFRDDFESIKEKRMP